MVLDLTVHVRDLSEAQVETVEHAVAEAVCNITGSIPSGMTAVAREDYKDD